MINDIRAGDVISFNGGKTNVVITQTGEKYHFMGQNRGNAFINYLNNFSKNSIIEYCNERAAVKMGCINLGIDDLIKKCLWVKEKTEEETGLY